MAGKQSMVTFILAVPVQLRFRDDLTYIRSMFTNQVGKQFSYTVHVVTPVTKEEVHAYWESVLWVR